MATIKSEQVVAIPLGSIRPNPYQPEKPALTIGTPDQEALYHIKRVGNDWVSFNNEGVVIAIADTKGRCNGESILSLSPVVTKLNPKAEEFVLNHTYRISFKHPVTHPNIDVVAQDVNVAIAALGGKPEWVSEVKVYKSSGKVGTSGGVGAGWSKCTEEIKCATEPSEDKPNCYQAFSFCVYPDCKTRCPRGKANDPLASFVLHTATEDNSKHRITYKGSEYESESLVTVVQLALGALPVEEALKRVREYPDSENKMIILAVLEGKQPSEVKA